MSPGELLPESGEYGGTYKLFGSCYHPTVGWSDCAGAVPHGGVVRKAYKRRPPEVCER